MKGKIRLKLIKPSINLRRQRLYHQNAEYRAKVQHRARRAYRRRVGMELSSCLKSLEFFGELAKHHRVRLPNGKERNFPVFTVPDTALVMQKNYQTVWRWIDKGQIPKPVLKIVSNRYDPAYHMEEVRVFIEEIGKHEKEVTYYRRDHEDVRQRILIRIGKVRRNLGV